MNTTPTDTQIADGFEKAANGLEKAIPLACTNEVDMCNDLWKCLSKENKCGTASCHGGWLAFAAHRGCIPEIKKASLPIDNYSYIFGAHVLVELCGFEHLLHGEAYYLLMEWANDNPELWGNEYGYEMFGMSNKAFGGESDLAFGGESDLTIQDIIAHYRQVAERLRVAIAA